MHVRSIPSGVLVESQHPAWTRFSEGLRGDESVLVVHAPAGVGRGWFARSWLGDAAAPVAHVRTGPSAARHEDVRSVTSLAEALERPRGDAGALGVRRTSRAAVVVDSLDLDWETLADHDWCMAQVTDLLLTPDEIAEVHRALAPRRTPEDHEAAAAVHRRTGG